MGSSGKGALFEASRFGAPLDHCWRSLPELKLVLNSFKVGGLIEEAPVRSAPTLACSPARGSRTSDEDQNTSSIHAADVCLECDATFTS
jgi:hypothetical protein